MILFDFITAFVADVQNQNASNSAEINREIEIHSVPGIYILVFIFIFNIKNAPYRAEINREIRTGRVPLRNGQ